MGRIADITQIFGISCGYNEGLTPKGATRWLSKIPLNKQKEVYYYTTSAGVSYYTDSYHYLLFNTEGWAMSTFHSVVTG